MDVNVERMRREAAENQWRNKNGVILYTGGGLFVGFELTPDDLVGHSRDAAFCRLVSKSRTGLAVYGTLVFVFSIMMFTAGVVVARNFKRLWLSDRPATVEKRWR